MREILPALSLVAVPGRRRLTLEVAREAERRGFAGLYVPSIFGNMAQSTALALSTERILFGTAIAPIYARTVEDFAHSAAYIHEVSGGRFRFGIGVAHAPSHLRMGVSVGRPLADIRAFVANSAPMTASAPCRRSSSPRCAGAWSRSPARSPKASSSPMPAARIWELARGHPGGKARRPGFPHRQHDPDLHF